MDPLITPGDPVEYRITVTGRVQGVGYRWFARETARSLGVVGWTRNMPDGSVVLEVMAPRHVIARFVAELQTGPPAAGVAEVRLGDREERTPLPDRFTVLR